MQVECQDVELDPGEPSPRPPDCPRPNMTSGLPLMNSGRNSSPHKYGITESRPNLAESITGAVIISQTPYKKTNR